jgi:hypothetical protein
VTCCGRSPGKCVANRRGAKSPASEAVFINIGLPHLRISRILRLWAVRRRSAAQLQLFASSPTREQFFSASASARAPRSMGVSCRAKAVPGFLCDAAAIFE